MLISFRKVLQATCKWKPQRSATPVYPVVVTKMTPLRFLEDRDPNKAMRVAEIYHLAGQLHKCVPMGVQLRSFRPDVADNRGLCPWQDGREGAGLPILA